MKWRPNHVSRGALVLLAAVSLGALTIAELLHKGKRKPHQEEKLAAAQQMQEAVAAVAGARALAGHEFDPERDPRQTGLIGSEFTAITTDRGVLSAKQIVTNPNFAALIVDILKTAGLKEGDTVAIAWTGSLPGANIAVLAAVETLKLRAVPIASVAASMSGANDPEFTWLDMERLLVDRGVFRTRSVAATLGGDEDSGKGLGKAGRGLIRQAAERASVELFNEREFTRQVARRVETYTKHAGGSPIKAYINVGGGIGSLGARINGQILRPGLNRSAWGMRFGRSGVMTLMLKKNIPVIHISYIDRLCKRYGYPTDPMVDDTPGNGPMFYEGKPVTWLIVCLLVGLLAAFFVTVRLDVAAYLRRRREILAA